MSGFVKTAALALSILMLASLAAACGGTAPQAGPSDTTAAPAQTEAETTAADPLTAAMNGLPEHDFDGYTFRVFDRSLISNEVWVTVDVLSETITGEPINDAVYERNALLCEKYNITLGELSNKGSNADVSAAAARLVAAGDDAFDTITDGITYVGTKLASPGMLIDLNSITSLHPDGECWDAVLSRDATVNGRLYFTTGDISIMDNYGTWCVMFNKDIVKNNNLPDFYKLVSEGKWTLEEMYGASLAATRDLDGNGTIDEKDCIGFLSESTNNYHLWVGGGQSITKRGADGFPELSMYSERSVAVFERVETFQFDRAATITGSEHSKGMTGMGEMFRAGNGLFRLGGMYEVGALRVSDVDFGVIPTPKFDEAQDGYRATFSNTNFTVYGVPVTVSDAERTGAILEAMARISRHTLTNAYFDVSLNGKFLRDDDSMPMIDIILSSRICDIGSVYDVGGLRALFGTMYSGRVLDMTSKYESLASKAQAALDQINAAYGR